MAMYAKDMSQRDIEEDILLRNFSGYDFAHACQRLGNGVCAVCDLV